MTIVASSVYNAVPKPTAVKMVLARIKPSLRMPSGLRVSTENPLTRPPHSVSMPITQFRIQSAAFRDKV